MLGTLRGSGDVGLVLPLVRMRLFAPGGRSVSVRLVSGRRWGREVL